MELWRYLESENGVKLTERVDCYFLANETWIAWVGVRLKPCSASRATADCVSFSNSTNAMSGRPGIRRTCARRAVYYYSNVRVYNWRSTHTVHIHIFGHKRAQRTSLKPGNWRKSIVSIDASTVASFGRPVMNRILLGGSFPVATPTAPLAAAVVCEAFFDSLYSTEFVRQLVRVKSQHSDKSKRYYRTSFLS